MNGLVLGESIHGTAVYARQNFNKGQIVLFFKGPILDESKIPNLNSAKDDRYLQISKNKYLGSSGDLDDFVNHSCDPNLGVIFKNDKIALMALRDIFSGEELTFDYSTTMDEDDWEMNCTCGSLNCRKIIRDFKYLDVETQNKYLTLKVVPNFILKELKSKLLLKN